MNTPIVELGERKTVYVQKRVNGLDSIRVYLVGEGVSCDYHYETKPLTWLSKIVVRGDLGEWNLRRVIDIVNQNDLRLEYIGKCFQIFT